MELLLWITILVLVSSSIFFQLMKPRKSPQNSGKSPPSPPGLPLIGHLHLLFGGLPQHTLRRVAQRYGGVVHLQLGEIFAVVISSREAAQQVMKTVDPACADNAGRISTGIIWYNKNDIIFSSYGAHWRQMRRIMVSDLLSPRNLASFGQIRRDETSRLISFLRSSADVAVDLTGKVSEMTCSVVCRAAFGGVVRDADELVGLVKKAGIMTTGLELADLFPSSRLLDLLCLNKYSLWRMRRRLDAILEGIMEEHKEKKSGGGEFGGEDIVDVLLRMQKDSQLLVPITDDAIKGFIIDTFSAGTETSSTAIDWAMAEMMKNPAVMAKAQAEVREAWKGKRNVDASNVDELKYLKLVVKETLRLHPPIPLLLRKCREACEVNGYSIPVNARVAVNVWSLGRDPLYWDEPEIFRPERFDVISKDFMGNNFDYIPFGAGRRICPGMNFGLANVEFPLAQLLYHFDWKLPRDMTAADVDMTETPGLSCSRKNALILVPMLYDP